MTRWRTRHRGTGSDRGAAAVEFAIVLIVLLLIVFAIIDFGRLLFVTQAVKSASREGARVAAVRADWGPQTTSGTAMYAADQAGASGFALAAGDDPDITYSMSDGYTLSAPDAADPLCNQARATANVSVTVSVTAYFKWLTPIGLLPGITNNFTGERPVGSSTTMRCE